MTPLRVARVLPAIVVLSAALALAGCTPGAPGATGTPAPSATATPTPTPTPTPTETATPTPTVVPEDPANASTWIVDGNGIGPIDIGMNPADLATYLPGVSPDACDTRYWQNADGVSLIMPVGAAAEQVYVISMRGNDADGPMAASPHTVEGIRIGSSQADVQAAYPSVPLVDDGSRSPYYAVPSLGRYVMILLNDAGAVYGMLVQPSGNLPSDLC